MLSQACVLAQIPECNSDVLSLDSVDLWEPIVKYLGFCKLLLNQC